MTKSKDMTESRKHDGVKKMFKKAVTIIFLLFCLTGILYLALPNYDFPAPPPDSIQSQEPADLESSLRRGYFTDYSREDVLDWYREQFNSANIFGIQIKIPTILLNYPPEYSQTLIRDQTSSTFLQEYVHPFREGIYINGFEPTTTNNIPAFTIDGKERRLKIIVRQVPSSLVLREILFISSALITVVIYNAFRKVFDKKR